MGANPYASSHGRLRADFTAFLPKEIYARMLAAKDVGEIAKMLDGTAYAYDLNQVRSTHQGIALFEIAVNRTFVRRNRHAFEATPFAGRPVVGAYLRRWDIENIGLIIASKAKGQPIGETEQELVSSRDTPAGLIAGELSLDDFRSLLAQPSVEAIASQLVKFGYGSALLPLVEEYARTHDIFPFLHALTVQYYRDVLASAKFFQGDEWVVRQFLQSEIDVRNALLLLKGKDASLPLDQVLTRFLDGGTMASSAIADPYGARNIPELVERLGARFPALPEGLPEYTDQASLTGFEAVLQRERAATEAKRMRTYPLSLAGIFTYLLLSELERADLRRIAFGKVYAVPNERVQPLLVSPRL